MSDTRPDSPTDFATKSAHAVVEETLDGAGRELLPLPLSTQAKPIAVRSLTNSPRCEPRPEIAARPSPSRRLRTVRVDAWSEPVSVSWTRNRTTVRKVNRTSRSTDWALPF